MHKSDIKKFAMWARNYLRQQIGTQAARFGLSAKGLQAPDVLSSDRLVWGDQVYGAAEAQGYRALKQRFELLLAQHGQKTALAYEQLIDEAAYSWFNRLCALRLMEVNGYLPRRVLSSSDASHDPDLLRDALQIALDGELPGIDPPLVDGLRHRDDGRLYRHLLVAQCNALKGEYPFLFETISEELALLLPEHLLQAEGLIRRFTEDIPAEDWQEVEIIGWLYQYYISERKDAVIGAKKAIASADIPAATQLFTPDWIVQYMVQNSLGKLWLESHPESGLKAHMPYYLDTPPQTPEVQAQIDAQIRPQLAPEAIKVIDPACGSGHILVYAFDLLFEIYREQGYRERDIPELILQHNLVGLDIDQRAAQLAAFALLIKARQKLRRLQGLQPRVVQVQTSRGISLSDAITLGQISAAEAQPWQALVDGFAEADTLGSLLTPPAGLDYPALHTQLAVWLQSPHAFLHSLAEQLRPLLTQAQILAQPYDVVVANPPYMGGKGFNPVLKAFAQQYYPNSKSDLFAMFMERGLEWLPAHGLMGTINQHAWMFLSSYEKLRQHITDHYTLTSMLHLGPRAFPEIGGEVVQSTAFVTKKQVSRAEQGVFVRLTDYSSSEEKRDAFLGGEHRYQASAQDFEKIPGAPVAYWVSERVRQIFTEATPLGEIAEPRQGLASANNDRFLRYWFEIVNLNIAKIGTSKSDFLTSKVKWALHNKGGEFRRWYGNIDYIVNWLDDGQEMKNYPKAVIRNENYYFLESVTWSHTSSGIFSARYSPKGFTFNCEGPSLFSQNPFKFISLLCSKPVLELMKIMNPTLHYLVGNVKEIPALSCLNRPIDIVENISVRAIEISKTDWDSFETSWDFAVHPLVRLGAGQPLSEAYAAWETEAEQRFRELQRLEEENNRYWIEAYGLQDELTPEVPDDQVTVRRAERERDITALLSYAVGCIMGRYSLDEPGLIHAGQAFDPSRHTTFPADADGIVPVHDRAWFGDDLVLQVMQWIKTVFGETHYATNLAYLAQVLGGKTRETPEQTLRRYFLGQFMKDHHQTYKKRPIYWFFTSGKKRAFNAYVYLHRYDSNTLARLRTDYLHPLQLKLEEERARLSGDPTQAKRLKELDDQLAEITAYDEILKHKADQRLPLDLDDGVAYNYTLFQGLVYEGADLKMADLIAKSAWKRELLAEAGSA